MSETETSTESQSVDTGDLDAFASDFFGEKKEPVQDAKPDEAEQDGDEGGEVAAEAQKDDTDPNADPDAEYKEAPKKKQTVQERIDEVVRQREEQKREFEAKIAALEAKVSSPKEAPAAKVDAKEPTPDDVNEDGTPKYELGEFDPKYARDLVKFEFAKEKAQADEQAAVQAQQAQEAAARAELATDWNTRVEAAKAEYPDFNEKGQQLLDGFGSLDQGYAQYLATTLMSMPHGTDVLYYLSNNPNEAKEIVNSGALKATLALGRISAKFADADAQKQLAKPKVSKAPEPPAVRARGTNGAFIAVSPDTDDLDAFQTEFFRKKG